MKVKIKVNNNSPIMGGFNLLKGNCLELMKDIPTGSIDLILCDLPYGTTACKWDTIIPFEPLWEQYKRIIKPNVAIVLTASQPFTSALVMSNVKWFKYDWTWQKDRVTGHLNAKRMPMRDKEDVVVFYSKQCTYNPQMTKGAINHSKGTKSALIENSTYGKHYNKSVVMDGMKHPTTTVKFNVERKLHPTQKPVALMEYLIRTYTNEGETVLDNCMGSGTTGVACVRTKRKFIGMESDPTYFKLAKERIENEIKG